MKFVVFGVIILLTTLINYIMSGVNNIHEEKIHTRMCIKFITNTELKWNKVRSDFISGYKNVYVAKKAEVPIDNIINREKEKLKELTVIEDDSFTEEEQRLIRRTTVSINNSIKELRKSLDDENHIFDANTELRMANHTFEEFVSKTDVPFTPLTKISKEDLLCTW